MDTRFDKEDGWVLVTPENTALDCFERDDWKSGMEWAMETDLQNSKILYYMGHCFEFGLGGENVDLSKAFYWYKASAEKGDADGQCSLGYFYEFGIGTEIDFEEAFQWYKAATEQGNASAQNRLGLCYEFGKGTEKDLVEAFRWYKTAAENGNARGQRNLGDMYEYGKGTEKNLEEAFRWYKASAEQGDSSAQNNIGVFYDNGIGVEKDYEAALKWFVKAAANGNSSAQCNLGLMYEFGRGTTASKEDAFKWYKISAENGDARGQYNLGDMYEHGKGTAKNIDEALKWYAKAAEQGNEDAKKKIVELDVQKVEEALSDDEGKDALRDVLNTLTDRERQVVDFRFGISDGCCRSVKEVARLFNMTTERVMQFESTALRKMKRRLENGDARAQFYLGMMYEKRNESEKDKVEAVKWYCKAAGQGHDGAKKKLAELEKVNDEGNVEHAETPVIQRMQKGKKVKKPSIKKAYSEMNAAASEVFVAERGIDVVEMNGIDDYLYCMEMPEDIDEEALLAASNELFHRIGVLPEERNLALNEEEEYCAVHRNEYSGASFVLFNHPVVMEHGDCGDTVRMFGETQRKAIAEEETEGNDDDGFAEEDDEAWMRQLAEDIKSGEIRSMSGEGYFVLKGEFYDAIEAGRKTTEYRDLTPHNLSLSIGIKTVKFQHGYGHPGKPPKQMRYEVSSVRLMDASDRECDPYNIPKGFIATTIAIHLGKRTW